MTRGRDTNGWRVPRPGTKSRLIYGLLKYGLTTRQIAAETGFGVELTRVLAYKIRRPNWANRVEHTARPKRKSAIDVPGEVVTAVNEAG
jgi:hypothetical protein